MVQPVALKSLHIGSGPAPTRIARSSSQTSRALNNLRGIVILIVMAFHSALAYVSWIKAPTVGFDSPPYAWRAFPIVDAHRFFGFDLLCAWQDVYLMSFMFFLSGLFVWPSLARRTVWTFVRDRVLRLGLPFAFGIAVIIPIAVYPAYRITAVDPGLVSYWQALMSLPFWPNGPLWFLWQLLVLNVIAALVYWLGSAAKPRPLVDGGAPPAWTLFLRPACGFGAGLCSAGDRVHALALVEFGTSRGTIVPAAAICRLFLRRRRSGRRRDRPQSGRGGRAAAAALAAVARRSDGFIGAVDGAHRIDAQRRRLYRH
jgi:hypothetical protein